MLKFFGRKKKQEPEVVGPPDYRDLPTVTPTMGVIEQFTAPNYITVQNISSETITVEVKRDDQATQTRETEVNAGVAAKMSVTGPGAKVSGGVRTKKEQLGDSKIQRQPIASGSLSKFHVTYGKGLYISVFAGGPGDQVTIKKDKFYKSGQKVPIDDMKIRTARQACRAPQEQELQFSDSDPESEYTETGALKLY